MWTFVSSFNISTASNTSISQLPTSQYALSWRMGALPLAAPVPQSLSPFLTTTASCPMVVVSRITYSTAQYSTVRCSTVQYGTVSMVTSGILWLAGMGGTGPPHSPPPSPYRQLVTRDRHWPNIAAMPRGSHTCHGAAPSDTSRAPHTGVVCNHKKYLFRQQFQRQILVLPETEACIKNIIIIIFITTALLSRLLCWDDGLYHS